MEVLAPQSVVAFACGIINLATIHCVVSKSFASILTNCVWTPLQA